MLQKTEGKKKYGIMGGTFDPIHIGHLVIAETAISEYGLEKIFFIPSAEPPHKSCNRVTPIEHRYFMVALATASNPLFEVLDIEMRKEGPSYTVETLQALCDHYGSNCEFYFITGMDSVHDLPTWREPQKLLSLCYFVAARRPGYAINMDVIKEKLGYLATEKIHFLDALELPISSTGIRESAASGKSIKYLVPENVETYINIMKLYKEH